MKKTLIVTLATLTFFACKQPPTTIYLKGELQFHRDPIFTFRYDGGSDIDRHKDFEIHTDEHGRFDTVVPFIAKAAGYYRAHANGRPLIVKLTPGDKIEITFSQDAKTFVFKGSNAEQNRYLNDRISFSIQQKFPQKENRLAEFLEIKPVIDDIFEKAMQELNALKGIDSEFKKMETARIRIDRIRNYLSAHTLVEGFGQLSRDDQQQRRVAHREAVIPTYIIPLMPDILDDKYVELSGAFHFFSDVSREPLFASIELPTRAKESIGNLRFAQELKQRPSLDAIEGATEYAQTLTNQDIKDFLISSIEDASKFLPGSPALDIEMEYLNGNRVMLSDFKGKVIYIDFWATWCGPCIEMAPKYEALAKKYQGQDIVFLALSIDRNRQDWVNYLTGKDVPTTHVRTTEEARVANVYGIGAVPNFVLIDKKFNIIASRAARPTDLDIENVLDEALGK